jgi:hypothetical protein
MSDAQPRGELPPGTRTSVMSLRSDRSAVCRWGEVEGVQYAELPHAFATTGGTLHSTPIEGLVDGRSYRWYAKCEALDTGCATPHDMVFGFHVAEP